MNPHERRILENVEQSGCHVTTVFDPDGVDSSFSYSAGFTQTVGQPEVIVIGLAHEMMGFMVNETLRKCQSGFILSEWAELHGLLQGHRCIVRAVHPRFLIPEYFNSALWFHERLTGEEMTRAFQIVWPGSADGLFPWEPGCSEEVRDWQPALYEPGTIQ